jgi:hypothetical protein
VQSRQVWCIRHHLPLPEEGGLFDPLNRDWWLSLDLSAIEQIRIHSDLDTLTFAQAQIAHLEEAILLVAIHDERVLFLIQLPGDRLPFPVFVIVTVTVMVSPTCNSVAVAVIAIVRSKWLSGILRGTPNM